MLSIRNVTRAFDQQPVLRGINLEVERGEIMCLLGPSGCGKTTLLRIVAGLETADSGDVLFEGESLRNIPVHERGFGLMFQDFALFPHLDVAGNIRFGLRMAHFEAARQRRRLQEVLELVGLAGFERRDVARLSGGERQRVALARSLAPRPRLLMLDEPLGSLDATLRERLVVELRAIIKQIGLTAVYVTHDQREALAIADRIAVMNAGRIEQVDVPERIYRRPRTVFVARFLGLNNIIPVLSHQEGTAHTDIGEFPLAEPAEALLLHPDSLALTGNSLSLTGKVRECVFQGDAYRILLQVGPDIQLLLKWSAFANHAPQDGETVTIHFPPDGLIPLFAPADEFFIKTER